jgi:uncharacterized protein (DUF2384 family)
MLNPILGDLSDASTAEINPRALAAKLSLSVTDLAKLIDVSRNSLTDKAAGPKIQAALAPLLAILSLAADATGSERRAILWFKFNPIQSLGIKTPMQHVADGHANWVLAHIQDVMHGVYA